MIIWDVSVIKILKNEIVMVFNEICKLWIKFFVVIWINLNFKIVWLLFLYKIMNREESNVKLIFIVIKIVVILNWVLLNINKKINIKIVI